MADSEPSSNARGMVGRHTFEMRDQWEVTVEKLLGHWGVSLNERIAQHEKFANSALVLQVLRLPLMLSSLFMSSICTSTSVETRVTAFWLLAIAQVKTSLRQPIASASQRSKTPCHTCHCTT